MGAGGTHVSPDEIAPYEHLARMIECELELVSQQRFGELQEAVQRRGEYLATLAIPCPEAALAAFERAGALHELVLGETRRAGDSIARSLAKLAAVSRAAGGYAGPRKHRYSATA
jgi:hypothetical protein